MSKLSDKIILLTAGGLIISLSGVSRMRVQDAVERFRSPGHRCVQCGHEIPPGKQGRRCKVCRK